MCAEWALLPSLYQMCNVPAVTEKFGITITIYLCTTYNTKLSLNHQRHKIIWLTNTNNWQRDSLIPVTSHVERIESNIDLIKIRWNVRSNVFDENQFTVPSSEIKLRETSIFILCVNYMVSDKIEEGWTNWVLSRSV